MATVETTLSVDVPASFGAAIDMYDLAGLGLAGASLQDLLNNALLTVADLQTPNRFDFENVNLDVATVETELTVDVDDGLGATVSLYDLLDENLSGVTLDTLISANLIEAEDLMEAATIELDIVQLEGSSLFVTGDLNNFISAHQVHLHEILDTIYLGDMVQAAWVDADDLIIRNTEILADLVDQDLLTKVHFVNKTLSSSAIGDTGVVSEAALNGAGLRNGDDVSLHDLIDSQLVSLAALIEQGLVNSGRPGTTCDPSHDRNRDEFKRHRSALARQCRIDCPRRQRPGQPERFRRNGRPVGHNPDHAV